MSKEDIPPPPERVPTKRRHIEALLPVHLAMLLARDNLTPSERKRLESEKETRKKNNPDIHVGFFGSRTGMTPQQKKTVEGIVAEIARPVEKITAHYQFTVYEGSAYNFHRICRKIHHQGVFDAKVDLVQYRVEDGRYQEIIKSATQVIVTTREGGEIREEAILEALRFARDRAVPVTVIGPDGEKKEV